MNTPFYQLLKFDSMCSIGMEIAQGVITFKACVDRDLPSCTWVEIPLQRENLKDLAKFFHYAWENSAALMRKAKEEVQTPIADED